MGIESHIGAYAFIAKESTYGTYTETGAVFVPLLSETLTSNAMRITREGEATGSGRWQRKPVIGRKFYRGSLTFNLYLDDIAGNILRACFGAATSSTLSGSSYKHIFPMSSTLTQSLCIEIRRGSSSTASYDFSGCMIEGFHFKCDNKGFLIMTIDVVAKTYAVGTSTSVSGIGTTIPPRFYEATLTDDAGSSQAIIDWSFDVTNGLNPDDTKFAWGSQSIIQPVCSEVVEIKGHIKKNWTSTIDDDDLAAYEALTEYDRLISFTTTQAIPSGGGNVYKLTVETPKIMINSDPSARYTAPGVRQYEYDYDAYEGTSDNSNTTPLEIVLQNGTSAYA